MSIINPFLFEEPDTVISMMSFSKNGIRAELTRNELELLKPKRMEQSGNPPSWDG